MPEGDTVWLTAHRLGMALRGEPLTRFELRVPRFALTDFTGVVLDDVVPVGKHLLIRFANGFTMHSHLRMDGTWQLSRVGERPRGGHPDHQIRAILAGSAWQATGYRLHNLEVVPTGDESRLVGHLGPDILGSQWATGGMQRAAELIAATPSRAIGEALLDQRLVAGIGNLYKVETLFVEHTHPWTPTAECDVARILATAHRLMRSNRDHPEQSTTGLTGRGRAHWVYGRAGQPCLRCRTLIAVAQQGPPQQQRITYWCPRCQPTRDSAASPSLFRG